MERKGKKTKKKEEGQRNNGFKVKEMVSQRKKTQARINMALKHN